MSRIPSGKGPVRLVDHRNLEFVHRGGPPGVGSDSIRSLHLVIYDALGRRLSESSIDVFPGVYSYQLPDVYRWSGVYYIEVSSGRIREIASHIIFPN